MDSEGNIYLIEEMRGKKTPEQIREDEKRLAKALQEDYDNIIGEQLEKLAAESEED